MAANQNDAVAQALWRAHVERALMSARKFRAGWPSPKLSLRDPMALRALVLLLVVVTFFAAGDERFKRVAAAFDWTGVVTPANFRIDAWVTPPVYTARPPVMLPGMHPGEVAQARTSDVVAVPAGSQLVIRATGGVRIEIVRDGGVEIAPPDPKAAVPKGSEEQRFVIKGNGAVTVRVAGGPLSWQFNAIPDRAPTIDLIKDPEPQARGALRLDYRVEDDYGVIATSTPAQGCSVRSLVVVPTPLRVRACGSGSVKLGASNSGRAGLSAAAVSVFFSNVAWASTTP